MIKISPGYLTDIRWLSAAACDFVTNENVDCWWIDISSNLFLLDHFLALMESGEIARADRYFRAKDKNRFIISRGALRVILGKYLGQPPSAIAFAEGINKKPYIAGNDKVDLHYNISHSGESILIAIANAEIGVDVEYIKPSFNYRDVLQETFSDDEISFIQQADSVERFFLLWTRKEALIKATGKGLDEDLKSIPSLDGLHLTQSHVISGVNDWEITSFTLNNNYFASIANSHLAEGIRYWSIDFKDSNILR